MHYARDFFYRRTTLNKNLNEPFWTDFCEETKLLLPSMPLQTGSSLDKTYWTECTVNRGTRMTLRFTNRKGYQIRTNEHSFECRPKATLHERLRDLSIGRNKPVNF